MVVNANEEFEATLTGKAVISTTLNKGNPNDIMVAKDMTGDWYDSSRYSPYNYGNIKPSV